MLTGRKPDLAVTKQSRESHQSQLMAIKLALHALLAMPGSKSPPHTVNFVGGGNEPRDIFARGAYVGDANVYSTVVANPDTHPNVASNNFVMMTSGVVEVTSLLPPEPPYTPSF